MDNNELELDGFDIDIDFDEDASLEDAQPKKERKKGRPKGSKNVKTEHIAHVPPACPACDSTNLRVLRKTRDDLNYLGSVNGQAYNKIVFRRVICDDCGQHSVQRSYEFEK